MSDEFPTPLEIKVLAEGEIYILQLLRYSFISFTNQHKKNHIILTNTTSFPLINRLWI